MARIGTPGSMTGGMQSLSGVDSSMFGSSYTGPMKTILPSNTNSPSTSGPEYNFLSGAGAGWTGLETAARQVIPVAGTITNFRATVDVAPGVGKARIYTVYLNGSPSALTVTISGSNVTASDTTHTLTVAAGDVVSVEATFTSTPAAAGFAYFVSTFTATSTNIYGVLLSSKNVNMSTGTIQYLPLTDGDANAFPTANAGADGYVPTGGTIDKMYVNLRVAPGVGNSRIFTLLLNGNPTALTVTISGAATTGNDTSHSVAVVAGDLVSWKCDLTGTPASTSLAISAKWTPTIAGEAIWMLTAPTSPSNSAAAFDFAHGNGTSSSIWNASEPQCQYLMDTATIKKLYAQVATAPSSGKSRAYVVQLNGSPGALTCTIADTATLASDTTHTMTAATGDLISVKTTPSGTPTGAGINQVSLVLIT